MLKKTSKINIYVKYRFKTIKHITLKKQKCTSFGKVVLKSKQMSEKHKNVLKITKNHSKTVAKQARKLHKHKNKNKKHNKRNKKRNLTGPSFL